MRRVAHKHTPQCIKWTMNSYCFFLLLFLKALEETKPLRLSQHYPVSGCFCGVIHIMSTRCQRCTVIISLESGLLFSVFLFTTDILRKFNPNIKGMSMGLNESGFNYAVSGAKVAWVWSVHFHSVIFKGFAHSFNLSFFTEESQNRCKA